MAQAPAACSTVASRAFDAWGEGQVGPRLLKARPAAPPANSAAQRGGAGARAPSDRSVETELAVARRAAELLKAQAPRSTVRGDPGDDPRTTDCAGCCQVLEVSQFGSDVWPSRPPSQRAIRHAWLTDASPRCMLPPARPMAAGWSTPSSPRDHSRYHAVELLRRAGLQSVRGRPKFRRGPRPEATAGDLVQRQFTRTSPDQLWVTDSTEYPPARASCPAPSCWIPALVG